MNSNAGILDTAEAHYATRLQHTIITMKIRKPMLLSQQEVFAVVSNARETMTLVNMGALMRQNASTRCSIAITRIWSTPGMNRDRRGGWPRPSKDVWTPPAWFTTNALLTMTASMAHAPRSEVHAILLLWHRGSMISLEIGPMSHPLTDALVSNVTLIPNVASKYPSS